MGAVDVSILVPGESQSRECGSVIEALDYIRTHPYVRTGDFLTVTIANLSKVQED